MFPTDLGLGAYSTNCKSFYINLTSRCVMSLVYNLTFEEPELSRDGENENGSERGCGNAWGWENEMCVYYD